VIVLGLTGSIGMGKSTAAAALRSLRLPLFDADRAVHRLIGPSGPAVERVAAAFPGVVAGAGGVDRRLLGRRVFADTTALERLEAILHPMVEQAERRFLGQARARRAPIAVLDIPLLFETGSERRCDYVIVVSATAFLQRQRVLRRPGMSRERFVMILKQQMPDAEKQRRADFVVPTGLNRSLSLRRLRAIVRLLRTAPPNRRARRRRPSYLERRHHRCVKSS
jgi:dephospho-CoA kinase